MNDEGVQNRIEQLVAEEHEILAVDPGARSQDKHERLSTIEVELDRCWDLLRQRRARREFDQGPGRCLATRRRDGRGLSPMTALADLAPHPDARPRRCRR